MGEVGTRLSFFFSRMFSGGRREVFVILCLEAEFFSRFPTVFSARERARAAKGPEPLAQESDLMLFLSPFLKRRSPSTP